MNRSTGHDVTFLKSQIQALETRKPFLREILDPFSQLLVAGAQVRAELEALADPELTVSDPSELSAGLPLLSDVRLPENEP